MARVIDPNAEPRSPVMRGGVKTPHLDRVHANVSAKSEFDASVARMRDGKWEVIKFSTHNKPLIRTIWYDGSALHFLSEEDYANRNKLATMQVGLARMGC